MAPGETKNARTPDDQRWLLGFKYFVPESAPVGGSWLEARRACLGAGSDLCSDDQVQVVCASKPEVGKAETWTLSWEGPAGWKVRGGTGCEAVKGGGVGPAPGRIGICCEPRTAISSGTTRQEGLLKSANVYAKLLEDAYNSRSADRVTKLLADKTQLFRTQTTKGNAGKLLSADWQAHSELRMRLVSCDSEIKEPNGKLDCDTVMLRQAAAGGAPEVSVYTAQFRYEKFKYVVFGAHTVVRKPWGP